MSEHERVEHITNLFDQAVTALIGPRHDSITLDSGKRQVVTRPSRWQELQDSIGGKQSAGIHSGGAMSPIWLDAQMLISDITHTVTGWWQHGESVTDRLSAMCDNHWRPDDIDTIVDYTEACLSWGKHIDDLLDPKRQWTLDEKCPQCNIKTAHKRDSAGEIVRMPALVVTVDIAECRSCKATWPPLFLMRMLKSDALENVGD